MKEKKVKQNEHSFAVSGTRKTTLQLEFDDGCRMSINIIPSGAEKTTESTSVRRPTASSTKVRRLSSKEQPREQLIEWAERIVATPHRELAEVFVNELEEYTAPNARFVESTKKHRCSDLPCLEKNRVILQTRPGRHNFIHANRLRFATGVEFLVTQAPMEETLEDFWRMCFAERVRVVAMLCGFEEGENSVAVYVPPSVGGVAAFGPFRVRTLERVEPSGLLAQHKELFHVKRLEVKYKTQTAHILHARMHGWPPQLAPPSPESVLHFWSWLKSNSGSRPIAVHCMSGVDRAMTLPALELASHRIATDADIDLADVVRDLRAMRHGAVVSHYAYLHLHVLLLTLAISRPCSPTLKENVRKFITKYQEHVVRKLSKLEEPEHRRSRNRRKAREHRI